MINGIVGGENGLSRSFYNQASVWRSALMAFDNHQQWQWRNSGVISTAA